MRVYMLMCGCVSVCVCVRICVHRPQMSNACTPSINYSLARRYQFSVTVLHPLCSSGDPSDALFCRQGRTPIKRPHPLHRDTPVLPWRQLHRGPPHIRGLCLSDTHCAFFSWRRSWSFPNEVRRREVSVR